MSSMSCVCPRLMFYPDPMYTCIIVRFLNGEVSLEGVWCPRLYDLWAATHTAADRQTGYTFSAVSSLVKRVSLYSTSGSRQHVR